MRLNYKSSECIISIEPINYLYLLELAIELACCLELRIIELVNLIK